MVLHLLNKLVAIKVDKAVFTLGRSSICDYKLTVPDISRSHCTLWVQGRGYYVMDNGSLNGTFVNGVKVNERFLSQGDKLKLGEWLEFTVHYED